MFFYNTSAIHGVSFFPYAIFGSLMGIFWVIVVVIFIFFVMKNKHHFKEGTKAEDLLKERLVKGEISAEEYKKIKKVLED